MIPTTEEARAVAREVTHYLNFASPRDAAAPFVTAMSHEHRTLQQRFTDLCVQWFKHLAELPDDQFDLRNEASVKLARAIKPALDEATYGFTQLPLI